MDYKTHWSQVFQTKSPTDVSWYQENPRLSLDLIVQTGVAKSARIIDVGAGASTLADNLLKLGYQNLTLLDISAEALQTVRERLGIQAEDITCIADDITQANFPEATYDVWHDRAVFHFLTTPEMRHRYIAQVRRALKIGGHIIVATFAVDGPEQCSGLTTNRYDAQSLHHIFGDDFELVASLNENHITPWNTEQKFVYCYCQMKGSR